MQQQSKTLFTEATCTGTAAGGPTPVTHGECWTAMHPWWFCTQSSVVCMIPTPCVAHIHGACVVTDELWRGCRHDTM
jgi:hypothetical protein